jgi:hypothetical protein
MAMAPVQKNAAFAHRRSTVPHSREHAARLPKNARDGFRTRGLWLFCEIDRHKTWGGWWVVGAQH